MRRVLGLAAALALALVPMRVGAIDTPSMPSGAGTPASSQNVGSRSVTSTIISQFVPTLSAESAVILPGQRMT